MSAENNLQEEVLSGLDFHLPCELRLEDTETGVIEGACGIEPEWAVECRHCHRSGLVCNRHAVRLAGQESVTCAGCMTTSVPRGLYWIAPLPAGV